MKEIQIVIFYLNGEACGSNLYEVQEIVQYQEVTLIPNMPDYMSGLINLRDKVVPVINLNKKFNLGDTEITNETKIIVTTFNGNTVGFLVNKVSEILKLSNEDIEDTPKAATSNRNKFLVSIAKKGTELISILDFKSILDCREIEMALSK